MALADPLVPTKAQMTLVNQVTTDSIEVMFNPSEFEESLGANWAKLTVPGLSHQRKHFIHTEDVTYQMDLFYNALVAGGDSSKNLEDMLFARTFLYSLVHPWEAQTILSGGPPRVLFIWPNIVSLSCVVTKLKFKYTRFNIEGTPVAFTASVTLEEIRDEQVSMEDILDLGTRRPPKKGSS